MDLEGDGGGAELRYFIQFFSQRGFQPARARAKIGMRIC
jgi:hypothetical protein